MRHYLKEKRNKGALIKMPILCFWSKFVSFTQLSFRQQIQFSKIWFCHFLLYMTKCPHAKEQENALSRY